MPAGPKFLLTEDVGRLARWLRLLGYDTALSAGRPPAEIYRQAHNERRVVVSRNSRLRPGAMVDLVPIQRQELDEQLGELMRRGLVRFDPERLFSRCDRCNVELSPVDKADLEGRVPPFVYQTQTAFVACPSCARIYWGATHCGRIEARIKRIVEGQQRA